MSYQHYYFFFLDDQMKKPKGTNSAILFNKTSLLAMHIFAEILDRVAFLKIVLSTFYRYLIIKYGQNYFLDYTMFFLIFFFVMSFISSN